MPSTRVVGADTVRPVIMDPPRRRFLLVPGEGVGGRQWTLSTVPIRPAEPCRRTVGRYLRRELTLPTLRISPLVGRLTSSSGAVGGVQYVILVAPAVGEWCDSVPRALGPGANWWNTADLRAQSVRVEPCQLLDLMDGYWGGWLPDGEITLD